MPAQRDRHAKKAAALPSQLAVVALKIEAIEAERAALRRKATQLAGRDSSGEPVRISEVANLRPPKNTGKASELAAEAVGTSARNVQKAVDLPLRGARSGYRPRSRAASYSPYVPRTIAPQNAF